MMVNADYIFDVYYLDMEELKWKLWDNQIKHPNILFLNKYELRAFKIFRVSFFHITKSYNYKV